MYNSIKQKSGKLTVFSGKVFHSRIAVGNNSCLFFCRKISFDGLLNDWKINWDNIVDDLAENDNGGFCFSMVTHFKWLNISVTLEYLQWEIYSSLMLYYFKIVLTYKVPIWLL